MIEMEPTHSDRQHGLGNVHRSASELLEELTELLEKGQKQRLGGMTAEELARLDELYRWSTVYLAQLRGRTVNRSRLERVNAIVTRAHSFIYVSPKKSTLKKVLSFYWSGFPAIIARTARFHLVSVALFMAGALLTSFTFNTQTGAAYALISAEEIRLPGSSAEQLEVVLRSGRDQESGEKAMFSSFLFTHNTKVGLLSFATGVLFGIPTVFLMFLNGAMLGTFVSVHIAKGVGLEMWAWILPHGVTEISAILLCGGAGFMLGYAALKPGMKTRKESLKQAGKQAILVFMGVVPMFLAAGLIEGFLRQSQFTTTERLLFAAATALFWVVYFWNGHVAAKRQRVLANLASHRANEWRG